MLNRILIVFCVSTVMSACASNLATTAVVEKPFGISNSGKEESGGTVEPEPTISSDVTTPDATSSLDEVPIEGTSEAEQPTAPEAVATSTPEQLPESEQASEETSVVRVLLCPATPSGENMGFHRRVRNGSNSMYTIPVAVDEQLSQISRGGEFSMSVTTVDGREETIIGGLDLDLVLLSGDRLRMDNLHHTQICGGNLYVFGDSVGAVPLDQISHTELRPQRPRRTFFIVTFVLSVLLTASLLPFAINGGVCC